MLLLKFHSACVEIKVESWQAEVDFTKEQLVNLKQRHESINAVKEDANNKNEEDESKREKTEEKENHVEKTLLTQSERELEPESQMKSSHIKVRIFVSIPSL